MQVPLISQWDNRVPATGYIHVIKKKPKKMKKNKDWSAFTVLIIGIVNTQMTQNFFF